MQHNAPCAVDFETTNAALRRICGAYQLTCERWWEFRGNVRTRKIGSLDAADVTVSSCSVIRDQRDTHYLGDHHFLVFQMAGTARMRQCGVEAVLQPGESTLIDSRFPSVFEAAAGFRQFSFHLPTQPLRERFGNKGVPAAQTIRADRGAGLLLSDMLRSFIANAASLEGIDLTDLTLQLLSAALGVSCPRDSTTELRHRSIDLREVAQFIEAHMQSADLSPLAIARHFNISLRQLYRIVHAHGFTPSGLIWRKRLEQAHRLLGSSGARVPILEIALNCGFKDGAHFSRSYRKMFGYSPRVSRSAAGFAGLASDDIPGADLITVS